MDEPSIDLRNHRGRLVRLAIAAAIGLAITIIAFALIDAAGSTPNSDPVGSITVPLLAIAVFAVTTTAAAKLLAVLGRRPR